MTLRILISLSLLLFSWQNVLAQLAPAADFFNDGAQLYISNNIPAALAKVETGRKLYPDDEKLKKLEELLKQQQQSQQNQQNQKNQQNQSQQSQSKNSQQQQQNSESQSEQKKDEQQKQQEQKSAAEKENDKKSDEKKDEGQPTKPGQMTPAEAKRLLDAQKGDEQILQLKPPGKPQDNQQPLKDW